MKVAVVHDWLPFWGGAESVLEQILECYPEADLYVLCDFLGEEQRARLKCRSIRTSFIQRLPFARKRFWYYLPWMPCAIEQFDLSNYDLVISSSHSVAKGVLTRPEQVHVSYVYSPMRYAWDLYHQHMRRSGYGAGLRSWWIKWVMHYLRIWDVRTANGVDAYAADSAFVARRIWKTYRREAAVIYPPASIERFALYERKEDFYLCVSRLVSYKCIDLIVSAFSEMKDKRLVVIGEGPELRRLQRMAGSNVEILGYVADEVVQYYMQRARAFLFAAEEDFGIVLIEAQACGTPVIAYGRGGATETVVPMGSAEPTGVLFNEQSPAAIVTAVDVFERNRHVFASRNCRNNAERFSKEQFRREFSAFVTTSSIREIPH